MGDRYVIPSGLVDGLALILESFHPFGICCMAEVSHCGSSLISDRVEAQAWRGCIASFI